MNELTIREELSGIDQSKAKQIEEVFAPMVAMLKAFEGQYNEVMGLDQSPEKSAKAKRLRLDVAKVRIEADKVRKTQKEEYLRAGNAIQGVYNILKFAVADKEDSLKEIETYYERIEEEKKKTLQAERETELMKYGVDGSTIDLGGMDAAIWANFLTGSKSNYAAVKEAERKAEQERIDREKAEKAERERVRLENEKLRAENEKAMKDREAAEDKLRKANEKAKAEQVKAAKEREAIQAKADAEARERAEKEQAEIEKREALALSEREAKEREAMAPDVEKLAGWADALEAKAETLSTMTAKSAVLAAVSVLNRAAATMRAVA